MPTSLSLDAVLDQATGIVRYNGFQFPPARKTTISFDNEYSDDGRTVKYLRGDITVDFIMVEGMGDTGALPSSIDNTPLVLDEDMINLRRRLSKPCQPLIFTAQGIGDFTINDLGLGGAGSRFDVNNGPKPRIVQWRPFGNKAAHIIWQCSTWFADCDDQDGRTGTAQFTYTVSWNIDERGLQNRNINGRMEVPLTRDPNTSQITAHTFLHQSSDQYREQIYKRFPLLARFTRTSSWNLSPDRKYLTFSITDSEEGSDNPYFPGIVRVSGDRSYSSGWDTGFLQWAGSVSVDVEVAPGYSRLRAWWVFSLIFDDIFKRRNLGETLISTETDKQSEPGDAETKKASWAYITGISIREDLYGRSFSFHVNYLLACNLLTLFDATGLFQPLDISPSDASWDLWTGERQAFQSPRGWLETIAPGFAGGRFITDDDVIVDICTPTGDALGIPGPDPDPSGEGDDEGDEDEFRKTNAVTPSESWIKYDASITHYNEDGTVSSYPLQKSDPVNEEALSDKAVREFETDLIPKETSSMPVKPVISRVRPRKYRIVLEVRALRIGYQVPVPNLVAIGTQKAYKTGTDVIRPKVLGAGTDAVSGKPYTLYGLYCRKEYILEGAPINGKIHSDAHRVMYS